MPNPTSFRLGDTTLAQLRALAPRYNGNLTTVVSIAVDRMYREETMSTETTAYDRAVARVDATPELAPYRDLLVEYDWNELDHYDWVATAPVAELVDWAETVRENEPDQPDTDA